jgi:hypothetical protein
MLNRACSEFLFMKTVGGSAMLEHRDGQRNGIMNDRKKDDERVAELVLQIYSADHGIPL